MRTIELLVWNTDENKMESPLVFGVSDRKLKPLIKCADGNSAYKDYPIIQYMGKDSDGCDVYEEIEIRVVKKNYNPELLNQ